MQWIRRPRSHPVDALATVIAVLGPVTVLGDGADLEMVEPLTTSLLVQATGAMVRAGSRTSRTGQSRTRSFGHAFLISYATRIRERLTAAGIRAPLRRASGPAAGGEGAGGQSSPAPGPRV